jgi:SAM-dependent methyltransferase
MAQGEFLDDPMPDVIEQWRFYFSALAPQAGDLILDVGCNTGEAERLLLRDYPRIGKVIGVEKDAKRHDYALSKWRKDGSPAQIALELGDALELSFPDNHFRPRILRGYARVGKGSAQSLAGNTSGAKAFGFSRHRSFRL